MRSNDCLVENAASRHPKALALESKDISLTFPELNQIVLRVAGALQELGVRPGTTVSFSLANDWRLVVLFFALFRLGAIAAPLSTRLPPKALLKQRQTLGTHDWLDQKTFERLFDSSNIFEPPLTDKVPEQKTGATLLFTSGSTGTPKAAMHTLDNHIFSALGSNENIPLVPGDRWHLSLPLFHVGGIAILFRCILSGATIVLGDQSLDELRISHVSLVPTQLLRMLETGSRTPPPPFLKCVLLGGSSTPSTLREKAHSLGWPLVMTYGLTEMSSQVTASRPGEKAATSGRCLSHRQIHIASDGEILLRGDTLFAGYLVDGKIQKPRDSEGWFHSGDLGQINEEGELEVLGRKDHLFISGGENIQPEEIENAIASLDTLGSIEQVIVVPVASDEFGARPVAFVRGPTNLPQLAQAWQTELRIVLPGYKIPIFFLDWPEELQAPGFKPNRKQFTELAEKLALERGIEALS